MLLLCTLTYWGLRFGTMRKGSESGRVHLEDSRRVKRDAQVRASVFPLGQATGADVDLAEQVKG
jgi:hypothetical protein